MHHSTTNLRYPLVGTKCLFAQLYACIYQEALYPIAKESLHLEILGLVFKTREQLPHCHGG